jgi:pimeloyl-ACP methyl ester carboxylesterase
MFDIPIPMIASHGFTVTTFDMPGMSRSSNAPPETYENVTAQKLAGYVIGLLDALNIDIATFWGCSSGGSTVLAIASLYPERMRSGMPHETPTYLMDHLTPLFQESDDKISETMRDFIPEGSVGDVKAWEALGEEVHARLWKNYPRWGRGYPHTLPLSTPVAKEGLLKRPLSWTVGASTPTHLFLDNIVTAAKAGVKIGVIPGMHFPYVSHPQAWVEYVVKEAKKHL